jgi:hypothetical protein
LLSNSISLTNLPASVLLTMPVPVCPQFIAEFLRTLFRIEHAGAFEFNPAGGTGYRVSQPTRPLYIEKYIGCAPYDEGRGYGGPLFHGILEEGRCGGSR